MNNFLKSALVATAGFALVVPSMAVTFSVSLQAKDVPTLGPTITKTDTTYTNQAYTPAGTFKATSLVFNYTPTFIGSSLTGTVKGSGTLTLERLSDTSLATATFWFSGKASRSVSGGVSTSFSLADIALHYAAETGWLSGFTGSGTLSVTDNLKNDKGLTTFKSDFEAVPEPTSFAALAIGGFGLLVRRRRSSK